MLRVAHPCSLSEWRQACRTERHSILLVPAHAASSPSATCSRTVRTTVATPPFPGVRTPPPLHQAPTSAFPPERPASIDQPACLTRVATWPALWVAAACALGRVRPARARVAQPSQAARTPLSQRPAVCVLPPARPPRTPPSWATTRQRSRPPPSTTPPAGEPNLHLVWNPHPHGRAPGPARPFASEGASSMLQRERELRGPGPETGTAGTGRRPGPKIWGARAPPPARAGSQDEGPWARRDRVGLRTASPSPRPGPGPRPNIVARFPGSG